MTAMRIPFFRPDIGDAEIDAVVATLRSGWLTTGPQVAAFEDAFKTAVHADHALAVNSCTSGLHLALEGLGVKAGDAVLVPSMTFAATAEVVRYQGATPVLVDCDPVTLNMDLADAARKASSLLDGSGPPLLRGLSLVGIIPVHVGGLMMDMDAVWDFASRSAIWTVEDAAHALPAAWRKRGSDRWQQCGESTSAATCFSFYANKTITTGEGGMVVTADPVLASRMRMMALHGLSTDAWGRYSGNGSWDYRIVAAGFKYNLTDIAAAMGLCQLARAESMRRRRQAVALRYLEALRNIDELELPPVDADRVHSWHLFPIRLRLDRLTITRADFISALKEAGIGCSVHWRPLHLHPYYQQTFGWRPEDCPVATTVWERLVSLPIFSSMTDAEVTEVIAAIVALCARHSRMPMAAASRG